jgi:hypothetical protein
MGNQATTKQDWENIEMAVRLILESGYFVEDFSKQLVERHLRELAAKPNIRKILELPCQAYGSLAQSAKNKGPAEGDLDKTNVITICTAIGLAGWAAWTAADLIRDGENPVRANTGNGADNFNDDLYIFSVLRSIIDELIGKLSLPAIYLKRLKHIIGMMEYANSSHCALDARERSSWKSMGAAIPLLTLMMKYGTSNKDISSCEEYFYYLILARQLSDDALDWKEDSGVIGNSTLVINWLEKAFEEHVKYKVAKEMLKRSRQAIEKARSISCFTNTGFLEELARYYEEMAERILKGKKLQNRHRIHRRK